jgi:hypothetical protein
MWGHRIVYGDGKHWGLLSSYLCAVLESNSVPVTGDSFISDLVTVTGEHYDMCSSV